VSRAFQVYETTDTVNHKVYRGAHACAHGDRCRYLGSGADLLKAIKAHGRQHFVRRVLGTYATRDEMYEAESAYVDQAFIDRPDTYNVALGGGGLAANRWTPQWRARMSGHSRPRRTSDAIGDRHSRLTIIRLARYDHTRLWLCQCDCGNVITLMGSAFAKRRDCGCRLAQCSTVQPERRGL
jgi:hypothetical protein